MLDQEKEPCTFSFAFSDGIIHRTNNSGTRGASKKSSPKNYNNIHELNDADLQFGTKSKAEDDSGICSPPLWSTSPRMSPQQRRNYYRCLSPTSKTQAIARGQRELMEMVKNMPESNYELSLKDLVEHPRVVEVGEEKKVNNKESVGGKRVNKKGSHVKRNGKIESGGFYLKMVFPVSTLGGKKNKKKRESLLANNNSSKVTPRNSVSDGSGKSVDKEWWKKKSLSVSGSVVESESGVSSINSGSMKSSDTSSTNSSRSNSRHEISASSCWPFIRRPESLSQK